MDYTHAQKVATCWIGGISILLIASVLLWKRSSLRGLNWPGTFFGNRWDEFKKLLELRYGQFLLKGCAAGGLAMAIFWWPYSWAIWHFNHSWGDFLKAWSAWVGIDIAIGLIVFFVANAPATATWPAKVGKWIGYTLGIFLLMTLFIPAPSQRAAEGGVMELPSISTSLSDIKTKVDTGIKNLGPKKGVEKSSEKATSRAVSVKPEDLPRFLLGERIVIPADGTEKVIQAAPAELEYRGKYAFRYDIINEVESVKPGERIKPSSKLILRYYDEGRNFISKDAYPRVTTDMKYLTPDRRNPVRPDDNNTFVGGFFVGFKSNDEKDHTLLTGWALLPEKDWAKEVQPITSRK